MRLEEDTETDSKENLGVGNGVFRTERYLVNLVHTIMRTAELRKSVTN